MIRRIEAKGVFLLPFWDPNDGRKGLSLMTYEGKTLPDAAIVFTGVYTSVEEQQKWMAQLNRPVIQALPYHLGCLTGS